MIDPLAEIVTLLRPSASFSKFVEYAGRWRIHRAVEGKSVFFAVLEGACRLVSDTHGALVVQAGDFVLLPATSDHSIESIDAPPHGLVMTPIAIGSDRFRVGKPGDAVNLRMQVGICRFAAPDAAMLVSLLPAMVLVRGEPRLAMLTHLVWDETRQARPARELVLERLLEVLLIEAFRCGTDTTSVPSVARGLADRRLVVALRAMHARPAHGWTVAELASEAAMSRSVFFARFRRIVGVPPMEYLLSWRMALAKRLLQSRDMTIDRVAAQVGYGSASTFSTAFARHVGMPPIRFARIAASGDGESMAPPLLVGSHGAIEPGEPTALHSRTGETREAI